MTIRECKCPPDCSACCRKQVIYLRQSEIRAFPKSERRKITVGPMKFQALRLCDDGVCIYLQEGRCAVYDDRPHICRVLEPGSWACNKIRAAAGLPKIGGEVMEL